MSYSNLMSPGRIGTMELKNRILLAAMGSEYCEKDGTCTERVWDYYEARARGGCGLLVLETSSVAWPAGNGMPRTIGFSEDRFLPGLEELTRRVHQHGGKIAVQLNHSGKMAQEDVSAGRQVMVPSVPPRARGDLIAALTQQEMGTFISAMGPDGKGPRFHPVTAEDIARLVQFFASAAGRAKRAGFDAIEIHGGHGYLISSFLSPHYNTRDDEYGGPLENRARLMQQVIRAIKAEVGQDYPVFIRIDAKEYRIKGGITPEDSVRTAQLAVEAGADAIHVSAYGHGLSGIAFTEAPLVHDPAGLVPFAIAVKKAVSVPVIAVGRIEPEVADQGIGAGEYDFVAMGRKLLADPDLPNKLAAGKPETIRPCIYCYVCVSKIFLNQAMCCASNPGVGREQLLDTMTVTDKPKRIAVVGAGPGGLEAARVLALRGHQVTLWDRAKDLGGTARIAALPYEPNGRLVKWLSEAVRAQPIDIRLDTAVSVDMLAHEKPDHVVVATGALREAPDVPGAELDTVFDGNRLRAVLMGGDPGATRGLSALQKLIVATGRLTGITRHIDLLRFGSKFWMPMGKRIVLVGGGLVGLELAEFLIERGREVVVLEPSPNLGAEISLIRRARVLHGLREHKVRMEVNADIREITTSTVSFVQDGESKTVGCDNVIISMGAAPNPSLLDELTQRGMAATAIGDCKEVGYIEGAMLTGREIGVAL